MTNNGTQDKTNHTLGHQIWNSELVRWLFSLERIEQRPSDPAEVLYRSFHITARCRFNASIRLGKMGSFSFLTATLLSLGLILIPVLQLADIPLAYPEGLLSSLQVFFAVAVLIYTVINSSAHYETRAKALNDCGDKIKELSRQLRSDIFQTKNQGTSLDLKPVNEMYTRISVISENHSRADYGLAMLQASDLYHITGIPRLWLHFKVVYGNFETYILPISLILAEFLVILDLLGITHVLTVIFNPS